MNRLALHAIDGGRWTYWNRKRRRGGGRCREAEEETEIPSTIERSDKHAQHIWKKAHDSAVETHGEGGRAHRVAYAALKHKCEKKGDRWVRKG